MIWIQIICFVDRASQYIRINETNLKHCLLSVCFVYRPVHVSGIFVAHHQEVEASWNVMAHAQKPHFVFWRNGWVYLNRRGRQFSRILAAEVCASAVVMLGTTCSEVVRRVLATYSIRQFSLHLPSRASPLAITFQLESTPYIYNNWYSQLKRTISTNCCIYIRCTSSWWAINMPKVDGRNVLRINSASCWFYLYEDMNTFCLWAFWKFIIIFNDIQFK
jgi:hypothetical protein